MSRCIQLLLLIAIIILSATCAIGAHAAARTPSDAAASRIPAAPAAVARPPPVISAAAASSSLDSDFVPLSSEDEERLIYAPAREERKPVTASSQVAVTAANTHATSTPATNKLSVVTLDLSGDTKLAHLCKQIPLTPDAAPSSMALSHLTMVLRALWFDSRLFDKGAGEHMLRVRTLEAQHATMASVFPTPVSRARGSAYQLREENLPEAFDATLAMLLTLDVALGAESRLDGADCYASDPSTGKSLWNVPRQMLVAAGLQPSGEEELNAFWCLLCVAMLMIASMGIGFTCGQRSRSKSLAHGVDSALHGGSARSSRQQRKRFIGWLLLVVLVITALAVCADIYSAYREEHRRLIILKSVTEKKGPPRGCSPEDAPGWLRETWRSLRGQDDDPCFVYQRDMQKDTKPLIIPIIVRYFTQNTLVLLAGAVGESMKLFLHHQSYLTQFMLLGFLLGSVAIVVVTVVYLAGPAALRMLCCCCGGGGDSRDRGRRARDRDALREARGRPLIESASDDSEDEQEEEEQERLRAQMRRLERKLLRNNASSSASSSSGSKRAAVPRLTAPRRDAHDSDDEDEVRESRLSRSKRRSRSRSYSRSRSRSRSPRRHRRRRSDERSSHRRREDNVAADDSDGDASVRSAASQSTAPAASVVRASPAREKGGQKQKQGTPQKGSEQQASASSSRSPAPAPAAASPHASAAASLD